MMNASEFKAIRIELGLTQEKLAKKLGYATTWVSALENGRKPIQKTTAMAMLWLKSQPKT